jgi:hypothetical protein
VVVAVAVMTLVNGACTSHTGPTRQTLPPPSSAAASTPLVAPVVSESAAAATDTVVQSIASTPASTTAPIPASDPMPATTAPTPAPTTTASTIDAAVRYIQSHTRLPIQAPTTVPGLPARSVLSAQVTADPVSYQVNLWLCSPPLPLNDPGIGNLACGGEAQRFGSFGAQQEASAAAAQAALPNLAGAQPAICQDAAATVTSSLVTTSSGTQVTVLSCPNTPDPLEVRWSARGWDYVLFFGEGVISWRQILNTLDNHLRTTAVPSAHGVFAVTYAGDGDHSQAAWAVGPTVYTAFNDHSDSAAVDLTAAMHPRISP